MTNGMRAKDARKFASLMFFALKYVPAQITKINAVVTTLTRENAISATRMNPAISATRMNPATTIPECRAQTAKFSKSAMNVGRHSAMVAATNATRSVAFTNTVLYAALSIQSSMQMDSATNAAGIATASRSATNAAITITSTDTAIIVPIGAIMAGAVINLKA
jgi:hypothetical protein